MQDDKALAIIKRAASLASARRPHEPTWREGFDFTAPERGAGLDGDESFDAGTQQQRLARVLSSVASEAADNLAANLVSGVAPSNSRWFEMDVDGAGEADKRWLSASSNSIWINIHSANFDAEVFDSMLDLVCAGWFVLYIDEDRDKGGFVFELFPMAQCCFTSSKPGGTVDTLYRSFKLTAEQAVTTYNRPQDKLSERTRKLAEDKPDTLVEFITEIKPNKLGVVNAILAKNLPFSSTTVEKVERTTVRESGYHEFPCTVPRWSRIPNSPYATGPVQKALPDIRMLNTLRRNEVMATELAIAGMWIAEDDGVLNPKAVKVGPRKIIVANSVESMKPLLTGSDFNVAFTSEERLERQIRKRLMADQLQPQDGPAMTATEVHVRVGLIRQLLGPVFGRMQAEFLQPLVERCFGLMYRAGALGPAPQTLAGRPFHVKYVSPMARSQKLEDVTAIERYAANIGGLMAQGFPEAKDLIDVDEAGRAVADGLGVPQRIVPDRRKVQAIRDARKQDAQQQQQQAVQMDAQQSMTNAMAHRVANAA